MGRVNVAGRKIMTCMEIRKVAEVIRSRPALEGAGVKLVRAFGSPQMAYVMDPFLLLDDFGSRYPHEYMAGFPWHPHRGIETITYLLKGEVHHEDSTGTKGVIRSGDLQWMSSGSGIFHSEMPRPFKGPASTDDEVRGFQLWVNLRSRDKFSDPSYMNIARESVPVAELNNGIRVKLVSGVLNDVPGIGHLEGPAENVHNDVHYMDIEMPEQSSMTYTVKECYTAFAYIMEGEGLFDSDGKSASRGSVVLYGRSGNAVRFSAGDKGMRILLATGKPVRESIAWYGPIVMNTQQQLMQAFDELDRGEFVKTKATSYEYAQ